MKKFQTSPDRELRRKAWKAVSDYFLSVTDEIDEIYDKMVKNRTEQARQLGYENYVELGYYRMNRNCYDKEMVENFRKQVKEYFVPFANKLHEQRRQRIGVEKLPILIQTSISRMEILHQTEHQRKFLRQDRKCTVNCLRRQRNFLIL